MGIHNRLTKTITLLATPLALLTLTACQTTSGGKQSDIQPSANVGYIDLSSLPAGDNNINSIRLQALEETASTLGARGALAWRSMRLNRVLEEQAQYLDHIFDFNQILLKNNVLPPVIVESNNNLNLDNNDSIRMNDKMYKIVAPARFVTAAPTWREYLWMNYKKPELPDRSVLPTTQAEAEVWNTYLKKGWEQGLEQANDIFSANLSRLKRDFLGMILYRKLLSEKMITAPQVSTSDLGVTGNSHELHLNDQIQRITEHSILQPNSQDWKPILTNP